MRNNIKNLKQLALTLCVGTTALAGSMNITHAEGFTDEQKAEIKGLFEEFLFEKPELILEAVDRYRADQEEQSKLSAQENLAKHASYFEGKDLPSMGNPDGDVTVVEFFDYNCGYCRKAFQDLVKLVEKDKNVRVVFQEMPILSPSSHQMAKVSLAAHAQGKYFEMHNALMDYRGSQSNESFYKVAEGLDLDIEKLKADTESAAMNASINKYLDRGRSLGIRGTPGFIIGDKIYPGYIGMKGLEDGVKKARDANKASK